MNTKLVFEKIVGLSRQKGLSNEEFTAAVRREVEIHLSDDVDGYVFVPEEAKLILLGINGLVQEPLIPFIAHCFRRKAILRTVSFALEHLDLSKASDVAEEPEQEWV